MNTHSNAIPGPAVEAVAPAVISDTQRLYWSLRRELWESRSIYIAPLAVAALILVGSLISTIQLPDKMRAAMALNLAQQHEMIEQHYSFAALLLMATTFIVAVFYSLDALHGERRDRSILFWKSMPVSDLTTVLSKASIPMVVLPLLSFALTVITHAVMLLFDSAALLVNGMSVTMLWSQLSPFQMWLMLLYHLLTVHVLWYAPIYSWLLLVSGWARRAAVLWAGLPLVAIGVVEKLAFNTTYFVSMLLRLMGGPEGDAITAGSMSMTHISPVVFLSSPGLWIGLSLAVGFLAAAVRLRRSQGPI